jgi:tetratricopeptide (TPR) repeat protein
MAESSEIPDGLESLLSADGEGPATRIDAGAARALIDGVLMQAQAPAPVVAMPVRRGVKVWWLLAAALVLTGSAAAMYVAQRTASRGVSAPSTPHVAAAPAVVPQPAPEPSAALAPAAPAPAPAPSAIDDTSNTADARAAVGPREAQDLLQRANRLRGEGDYRGAERVYLRVVAGGSGAAAYSARVAAAALRAEQFGDARGALRLYRDALRVQPGGPLSPEIHEGMAQAFQKLGAADDERRALRALLDAAGSGPSAERARQRLQQLDSDR